MGDEYIDLNNGNENYIKFQNKLIHHLRNVKKNNKNVKEKADKFCKEFTSKLEEHFNKEDIINFHDFYFDGGSYTCQLRINFGIILDNINYVSYYRVRFGLNFEGSLIISIFRHHNNDHVGTCIDYEKSIIYDFCSTMHCAFVTDTSISDNINLDD